jgi:hypothetical protein
MLGFAERGFAVPRDEGALISEAKILRIIAVYDEPRRNGILHLVGTGVPDGPSVTGVP